MADMLPKISYEPGVKTGLASVNLTEPGSVTMPPGQSNFPTTTDEFKTLTYSAPDSNVAKQKLSEYHSLMVKITGGTGTNDDLTRLQAILGEIRDYVLTEDDLNKMVDALRKIENYLYTFLRTDLENKAQKMDEVLGNYINVLNAFTADLEAKYKDSPSNYPIPMESILFEKLEKRMQSTTIYTEDTMGTIVGAVKPSPRVMPSTQAVRPYIWIDTNISDAD